MKFFDFGAFQKIEKMPSHDKILFHKLFGAFHDTSCIESDSVNRADSGDIKLLVQFLGNTILKFSLRFRNCVECVNMRGYFILKTTQYVQLFMLAILIYETRGTHLISRQPTQSEPMLFPSLWRHRYQKMWNFLAHLLINTKSFSDGVHLPKRPRKSLKIDFW